MVTIAKVIEQFDKSKINSIDEDTKIKWLSDLDGTIKEEIIDTHDDGDDIVFDGYDGNTPRDTELLVGDPYGMNLYLSWMEAKANYLNGEYNRYNNAMIAFNSAYSDYAKYYNRHHMPKTKKMRWW